MYVCTYIYSISLSRASIITQLLLLQASLALILHQVEHLPSFTVGGIFTLGRHCLLQVIERSVTMAPQAYS